MTDEKNMTDEEYLDMVDDADTIHECSKCGQMVDGSENNLGAGKLCVDGQPHE